MNQDREQISINLEDASWKQRCSEKMEELKNTKLEMYSEFVGDKKYMSCKLYKAVESGNVDDFVEVLKHECTQRKLRLCDIFDQVTGTGDSLLHVAAEMGREQIAELICDHFPELLIKRNKIRGDTVLHAAARSENCNVVKLMLSQYETVKSKLDKEITRETNEYGNTPLHEAVYIGNVDVVKDVFHADEVAVHYLNKAKQSPLYLAVVSENEIILNLLLKFEFLVKQPRPLCSGNSPLHAAIHERNPDVMRTFIGDLEHTQSLIEVILKERSELVKFRNEDGNTCLHYAAEIGYVKGFGILLDKFGDIAFEGNNKGNLPVHFACKRGHVEVVKEFLRHEWHINPNVLNQKGQNMLHVAAKNGRINVVRNLLRYPKMDQFIINQKDNDGNTPLHLASMNLFPKVLYYITQDKRTNVKLLNNNGLTARDITSSHVTLKNQVSMRKFVANSILQKAGVPVKVDDMLRSRRQQPLKENVRLTDLINTYLVVATLMVTVTLAAGFTVPGGLHSSDDPNPEIRGMAVFAHKPYFFIFTLYNMLAMFNSVVACALMFFALTTDQESAEKLINVAGCCLIFTFFAVPVAFYVAVLLVVENNFALTFVVTVIGLPYSCICSLAMFFGILPIGTRGFLGRQGSILILWILVHLIIYDNKPSDRPIVELEETQTDIQKPNQIAMKPNERQLKSKKAQSSFSSTIKEPRSPVERQQKSKISPNIKLSNQVDEKVCVRSED